MREIERLHFWFEKNKREFPWREERTPYKVWISEVMLQQTRASVVVAYFNRWMELFPNVQKLAEASSESVMKAWEGLGYYSRARRLHAGAKEICSRFGGQIPSDKEELFSIEGLGPYTVGAILSFGFCKRAPAVDGNVIRVLSRYFLIEENISKTSTRKLLEQKAEEFLDAQAPWVSAEALIELGATLCQPKPRCEECPLKRGCLALKEKKAELLPIKSIAPETTFLSRMVAVIQSEDSFLVKKEAEGKVMAGLYEFPYFDMGKEIWSSTDLIQKVRNLLGCKSQWVRNLASVKHTFTRYQAQLYPVWLHVEQKAAIEGWEWISVGNFSQIPFSSGHRKIVQNIISSWKK